jgi:hypothetical protein
MALASLVVEGPGSISGGRPKAVEAIDFLQIDSARYAAALFGLKRKTAWGSALAR